MCHKLYQKNNFAFLLTYSLKFWSVMDMESEKSVSHSDAITCFTVTYDCQTIITGSNDMSLKVWEVGSGKLTQVDF